MGERVLAANEPRDPFPRVPARAWTNVVTSQQGCFLSHVGASVNPRASHREQRKRASNQM
jgi:hypothetical protein